MINVQGERGESDRGKMIHEREREREREKMVDSMEASMSGKGIRVYGCVVASYFFLMTARLRKRYQRLWLYCCIILSLVIALLL